MIPVCRYVNGNVFIDRYGFLIKEQLLNSNKKEYKFPDIIEIKLTNKCIYECSNCPNSSKEYGINDFNYDLLIEKLSKFPNRPILFILSGGNILENLNGFYKISKFIKNKFKNCTIIVNINALDINRVSNLSHSSFGKEEVNCLLYDVDYFSISLNQKYDKKEIFDDWFFKEEGLGRLYTGNNIIFRLRCDNPKFYEIMNDSIIEDYNYKQNTFIFNGKLGNNREYIQNILKERRYHYNNPQIYFDNIALRELNYNSNDCSLGWNNYLFIDATKL